MSKDLDIIKKHCEEVGMDFTDLAHNSYVTTQLGVSYNFTNQQLDDLYSCLVFGVLCNLGRGKTPELMEGIGPDPEDRNTLESWHKLRSELLYHGSKVYPKDEWVENNPESDVWLQYIQDSFKLNEEFEKDPEKWFVELREKSKR